MADDAPAQPDAPVASEQPAVPAGKPTMEVKVYAPFQIFFEGTAYSVSAVNKIGPFDILPHHRNFICMVLPCNVIVESPEGRKVIKVSRALMHVKADRVAVFVDV
jgi:F0F1-type ATP synthase epsilon subunit